MGDSVPRCAAITRVVEEFAETNLKTSLLACDEGQRALPVVEPVDLPNSLSTPVLGWVAGRIRQRLEGRRTAAVRSAYLPVHERDLEVSVDPPL